MSPHININTSSHRDVHKLICLSQDVRGQVTTRTAAVPTLRSTNYFLELLEEQLPLPLCQGLQITNAASLICKMWPHQDMVTIEYAMLVKNTLGRRVWLNKWLQIELLN
jgi:hypothetical protein